MAPLVFSGITYFSIVHSLDSFLALVIIFNLYWCFMLIITAIAIYFLIKLLMALPDSHLKGVA